MFSRPLAILLLVLGVVTAAAGGSYLATRHNAADATVNAAAPVEPAPATVPASPTAAGTEGVAETEAAVTSAKSEPVAEPAPVKTPAPRREEPRASAPASKPRESAPATRPATPTRPAPPVNGAAPAPVEPFATPTVPTPAPEPVRPPEPVPEPPRVPQFEDLILPASSVIGLQMESALTSERARIEDRVDARVTRDVLAGGRVAIPAGSRVIGSVTAVERGGKVKERARLGVRFHTLVLGDGTEVRLQTDAVYREGESPAGDSAKKIGGAAVGGAILGAILGGKKGAAIGGATGAGAGTAAVMAGDRQAATLARGEVITAKLSSPATITVERRE